MDYLTPEWETPSETPTPETHTEQWEAKTQTQTQTQESLLVNLVNSEDLTEQLDVTTILDFDDLLGDALVEDDVNQLDEALGLSDTETGAGGSRCEVEVQFDSLALNDDSVVDIGLVVQSTWVQLVDTVLNRCHKRFLSITTQAEHFELRWDFTEWPFNESRALNDSTHTTAGEFLDFRAPDTLGGVLSNY